ncbi:hypothetical protein G9P44_006017 [Scheffersomyces stipitis]|nr:hypothetical protein G9P44_006017 [Scheffersomyces stipitis]
MDSSTASKDKLEDLASLFLPDILHPMQSSSNTPGPPTSGGGAPANSAQVKQEEYDSISPDLNLLRRDSITSHTNTPAQSTTSTTTSVPNNNSNNPNVGPSSVAANFTDFLHNNNFINSSSSAAMMGNSFTSPMSNPSMAGMAQDQNHNLQSQEMASTNSQNQQSQQLQQQQSTGGHINHYAGYIPFEATSGLPPHHQHHLYFQQNQLQFNGMFPPQSNQQSPQQQPVYQNYQQPYQGSNLNGSNSFLNNYGYSRTPNNEMNWLSQGGFENYLGSSSSSTNINAFANSSSSLPAYTNGPVKDAIMSDVPMSFPPQLSNSISPPSTLGSEEPKQESAPLKKKKKLKARKIKDIRTSDYQIDYKPAKLRKLLDFKRVDKINTKNKMDYKIIDKDNHEITIDFNGFLNGRFITNDNDNIYYLLTKKKAYPEGSIEQHDPPANGCKMEDPKVISCYRRNYIQIAMNMNIHGFKNNNSKLLKLQTSEYGYTITRVIKYFKIEISANISNKGNVPIFIKSKKVKDKQKDKKPPLNSVSYELKEDSVQPSYINTREHIVNLNNDTTIENGQIDKYFVIKKIQFKNATPNNGNLAFQNYYHLNVKLSCVVADLYYDDYVDDEMNNGLNGNNTNNSDNNEIALFELVSEPITVRGRNPSFYAERKDILIKGRSSTAKKSFKNAGRSPDADDDDDEEQHMNSGDVNNEEVKDDDDEFDDDDLANKVDGETSSAEDDNEEESNNDDVASGQESTNQNQNQQSNADDGSTSTNQLQTANKASNSYSPIAYSAANQPTLDLDSGKRYKYFPISNVYYLPPINVVYFPHRAHQHQAQSQKEGGNDTQIEAIVNERRKSSNVYFK